MTLNRTLLDRTQIHEWRIQLQGILKEKEENLQLNSLEIMAAHQVVKAGERFVVKRKGNKQ